MYYIVGLGNPGDEYENSRHNAGRMILGDFLKKNAQIKKVSEMKFDKKLNVRLAEIEIDKDKARIIFPETFMNKSGLSLKPIITSKKKAENLIVVHDDIDLPLGRFKISFGKSSGGHKGVESIIKNIGTKNFIRIRMGVSPATPKGQIRKPDSKKVIDFIIHDFKLSEIQVFKKNSKKITLAIEAIIKDGIQKAISSYNG